jgi:hypothetical protein
MSFIDNDKIKATNHKCKLQDGSIVNFDASNSKENKSPNDKFYEYLGKGKYHSVDVDGKTITLEGEAYFFRKN